MRQWRQRTRLLVVAAASFVLLVLVLPQLATGIGLGGLAAKIVGSGSCGSSGSSGSMGSGSGSSSTCGPPVLTVTPDTDLADGQSVTVTGTGFSPYSGVGMVECSRGARGAKQCDLSSLLEVGTSPSGSFSTPYVVSRILTLSSKLGKQKSLDCAPARCILGAANLNNYSIGAKAPLAFNPKSPLALAGTVNRSDTVVPKTGVAHIAGTAACIHPGIVQIYVTLDQIYGRFNFVSSGETVIRCKKESTWTVVVKPGTGLYAPGKATVHADLSTEIGNSYRDFPISRHVVLKAAK